VARRRARCAESLNAARITLQIAKQAKGEGQDEDPTTALSVTTRPRCRCGRVDQIIK